MTWRRSGTTRPRSRPGLAEYGRSSTQILTEDLRCKHQDIVVAKIRSRNVVTNLDEVYTVCLFKKRVTKVLQACVALALRNCEHHYFAPLEGEKYERD